MAKEVVPSSLSLFDTPPSLLSIEDSYWETINSRTSLDSSVGQIAFTVPEDLNAYTALSQSFLVLNCKITKPDGTDKGDELDVGVAQYPVGSMFTSVELTLNDVKVRETRQDMRGFFHRACCLPRCLPMK